MLKLHKVTENVVWDHWKMVEGFHESDFRSDIRDPLPMNIEWFLVRIEHSDIQKLYVISSDDWGELSRTNYLVESVAKNINIINSPNKDTLRIQSDIIEKIKLLKSGATLDTKLILVTDDYDGLFTIIEGNRRAVAFLLTNQLVGIEVYLGITKDISKYHWSRYTYKNSQIDL